MDQSQQPLDSAASAATQTDATSAQEKVSAFVGDTVQGGKDLVNQTVESGKKWIADAHLGEKAGQVPQKVKEWGTRAVARVSELSTTQKVVGGAILAAGLGWLALRRKKDTSEASTSVYGRQKNDGYSRKTSYGYQTPSATERHSSPSAGAASNSGSSSRGAQSRYSTVLSGSAASVDRNSSSYLDE